MKFNLFAVDRRPPSVDLADALKRLVHAIDRWDLVDMESVEYSKACLELDDAMQAARRALGVYGIR